MWREKPPSESINLYCTPKPVHVRCPKLTTELTCPVELSFVFVDLPRNKASTVNRVQLVSEK